MDADAGLLARGLAETADWAEAQGFDVGVRGGLTVSTPHGVWRIATRVADLADLDELDIGNADAVVCSALLDLVSRRWLESLAATVRGPMLACLNVDGHDRMMPSHAGDIAVTTGFRRDQARDKGFGPSVGRHAEAAFRAALPRGALL